MAKQPRFDYIVSGTVKDTGEVVEVEVNSTTPYMALTVGERRLKKMGFDLRTNLENIRSRVKEEPVVDPAPEEAEEEEIMDPPAPEDMSILELSEEAIELSAKAAVLGGWAAAPLHRRLHQLRTELGLRSREELGRGRWKPVKDISPVIRSRALWILDCWNGSVKKSYLEMDPTNQKNFLAINQVDASDADAMHAAIVEELREQRKRY